MVSLSVFVEEAFGVCELGLIMVLFRLDLIQFGEYIDRKKDSLLEVTFCLLQLYL